MLAVERRGSGPPVVLVHGGLGPEANWERQAPLAERWTLVIPWLRGYGESPPAEPRIDWEVSAADVAELLPAEGAHLAGFSYGGVVGVMAALRAPERVRSLTVIEAPFYTLARQDPRVAELEQLSNRFLAAGPDAPPDVLRDFLALSGMGSPELDALPPAVEAEVRRVRGGRPPGEAEPDVERLARAPFPKLVVSGDHEPGIETVCDALAAAAGGERAVLPGAGHAVMRAPGFNQCFEAFLRAAET